MFKIRAGNQLEGHVNLEILYINEYLNQTVIMADQKMLISVDVNIIFIIKVVIIWEACLAEQYVCFFATHSEGIFK